MTDLRDASAAVKSPDVASASERTAKDATQGPRLARLRRWAVAPVDGASLAVFRIAFGLVVVWEAYRYVDNGWITRYWIDPSYHFTYPGFGWVQPLAGNGMYVVWAAIALCGLLIALGAWYRIAAATFALLFTYQFLLEYARYLNHFYLMCLIGWILAVVPAHRVWSVDAAVAGWRSARVPRWGLRLVQFQIAVMYVGGGIAKLTPDWLAGRPLSDWIAAHDSWPLVGPLLAMPTTGVVLAWAGLALDLLIVPAVLWRRTRVVALVSIALFHLANARLFQIGVFPVLAIAATLVLLPPDWPRTVRGRVMRRLPGRVAALEPPASTAPPAPTATPKPPRLLPMVATVALCTFVAAQVVLPLRHLAYPGDVNWTEEGHDFSWHMKLRSKGGDVAYTVHDTATGAVWIPDIDADLTSWQASKLPGRPHMILAYAHDLGRQAREDRGFQAPAVYANAVVSLNGRPHAPMVDTTVDLLRADGVRDFVLPHPDDQD